jgi:casein kinase II subunit beta
VFMVRLYFWALLYFTFLAGQDENDSEIRHVIEKSARHTYGLIHSRFILTTSGLEKMLEKFENGVFGTCPRVLCDHSKLLPSGISDIPGVEGVKLFCPNCEDVYTPKSGRHAGIDGAYFGTTFAHLFIQTYPNLAPQLKSRQKYIPKIFGFRISDRSNKENQIEDSDNMMIQ